jgi:hypothetical protein
MIDDFAVAGENRDGAGEPLLIHGLLSERMESLEAFGGKADGLGLGESHVDGDRGLWRRVAGHESALRLE